MVRAKVSFIVRVCMCVCTHACMRADLGQSLAKWLKHKHKCLNFQNKIRGVVVYIYKTVSL